MSKIKSAREKKALSLKKDRRNDWGRNSKASRNAIPRRKQLSHMGERRAVAQILSHLREGAAEGDATNADALAKATIAKKKRKAFKKDRDIALGVVIERKLARRREQSQNRQEEATRIDLKFHEDGVFDTPYDPALHKRSIRWELRSHRIRPILGPHKKKSQRYRWRSDRESARRWKEATLRDAPLLAGFFAEQPQWRERILRWCEEALAANSD